MYKETSLPQGIFIEKKSKTMREQLKGNSLRKITLVTTTIGWTKLMQGTG